MGFLGLAESNKRKCCLLFVMIILMTGSIVSGLLFYDYRQYTKQYKSDQKQEIESLQSKCTEFIKGFKNALSAYKARIESKNGELQAINGIIKSISYTLLKNRPIPFQKVSYYRGGPPYLKGLKMTRFGQQEIHLKDLPKMTGSQGPFIIYDQGDMVGQISWGKSETLELEIFIDDILAYLSPFSLLEIKKPIFDSSGNLNFSRKEPLSYSNYFFQHVLEYSVFGFLSFIFMLLLIIGVHYAKRCSLQLYAERLRALEKENQDIKKNMLALRIDILGHETEVHSMEKSHRLSSEMQNQMNRLVRSRLHSVYSVLDKIKQSMENGRFQMTIEEQCFALNAVIQELKPLSVGIWKPESIDHIDLKALIQEIIDLFSYKIVKVGIDIHLTLPEEDCFVYGDHLLYELILINILGKAIYHIPPDGTIEIELEQNDETMSLILKDNGFVVESKSLEHYVNQACPFFVEEHISQVLCSKIKASYSRHKLEMGETLSILQIQIKEKESQANNVVQFRKM